MPVKSPARRHYSQKKHPKHFARVYFPYLPLAISIALSLMVSFVWHPITLKKDVLAYATNVSRGGLLAATNTERKNNNKKPLTSNPALNSAAQAKAEHMAANNYWAHVAPDGKQPWFFIDGENYKYQKAGENLAYGFDSSDAAVAGWMNSQSHKDNLLDPIFVEVGFGIANVPSYQSKGNQTVIVAMYGKPLLATASPAQQTPVADSQKAQTLALPGLIAGSPSGEKQQRVTVAAVLSGGQLPWVTLIVGLVIGGISALLILKHGIGIRRAFKKSEKFALRHPLLDVTLISYLVLGLILFRTSGFIG